VTTNLDQTLENWLL